MRRLMTLTVGVCLLFNMVPLAFASYPNNTTPANARFLMFGQAKLDVFAPTRTIFWYKAKLVAGRSYTIYVWAPDTEASIDVPQISHVQFYTDEGVTKANTLYFNKHEPRLDVSGFNQEQTKIIPTKGGTHWLRFKCSPPPISGYVVNFILIETTLFSPWYFVDSADGYDAYVEIRNNTSSDVHVRVKPYDSTGTRLGPPSVVNLPRNGNTVVQIGTTFGIAGGSGSVQIAHNGPPGAIAANITTMSATTGLSFDAPFTPRQVWSNF